MITINDKQENYLKDLVCATYNESNAESIKRIALDICAILDFIFNTKEDKNNETCS